MRANRDASRGPSMFFRFWSWIKAQIVQDVPPEIALCEFDCSRAQCTQAEWATCPRRLQSLARSEGAMAGHAAPVIASVRPLAAHSATNGRLC